MPLSSLWTTHPLSTKVKHSGPWIHRRRLTNPAIRTDAEDGVPAQNCVFGHGLQIPGTSGVKSERKTCTDSFPSRTEHATLLATRSLSPSHSRRAQFSDPIGIVSFIPRH
jgi:hypothetical protein